MLLELPIKFPYTNSMKNKNNKNNKVETLKERYKVGDVLKVKQGTFDGRDYGTVTHYVTVTQVNKVTVYGQDKEGQDVILDLQDLANAKKVIQMEILA
jgi:uncharacterized protein YerC